MLGGILGVDGESEGARWEASWVVRVRGCEVDMGWLVVVVVVVTAEG